MDIGGTRARFALARLAAGRAPRLSEPRIYRTADYPSLDSAWRAFVDDEGGATPREASIAVAGPIEKDLIKLTNSSWVLTRHSLGRDLGLDRVTLLNDFGAMAHAVSVLDDADFVRVAGPDVALPSAGVISVIGPGTGLGVAQLIRRAGQVLVIETEGGHQDFAPLDPLEDAILARLRLRYRRVSVERLVSGPGLGNFQEALAAIEGRAMTPIDDAALWLAATGNADPLAREALERLCLSLGSVVGDLALAQGAVGVALTGALARRILDHLRAPGFWARFVAKGRHESRMAAIPIRLASHPYPGLLGAAVAFGREHPG